MPGHGHKFNVVAHRVNGEGIVVCPPCATVRGYTADDLLDGVVLMGSKAIHDRIKEGAQTLAF